mgnify:FL=1
MSRTTRSRGYYGWLRDDCEDHYLTRTMHLQLFYRSCGLQNPRWYAKYVHDDEETIRIAKDEFARWARDGRDGLTETSRNSGFKYDAKKTVRRANKSFCRSVLSGDDHENIPTPIRKEGKKHKWDWW